MNFKAFVITIQQIPASVDVAQRCIDSGKKFGVPIMNWTAMTPLDDPAMYLKSNGVPLDFFREKFSYFDSVISAFSSHFSLWKKCAEVGTPFLIFEHDAVIVDNIPMVPNYKGVLSYGAPSYGNFVTPPILGVNKLVSKQYFPGAHAYLMKPEAAAKVVGRAKIDACPTDVFFHNQRFDFLEEYYPWPVVAKDSFTTIQNKNGCLAKHEYAKNPKKYKILRK